MNLYLTCKDNNVKGLKLLIKRGFNNYEKGLEGAFTRGILVFINYMLKSLKLIYFFPHDLYCACYSGSKELIDLVMSSGSFYKINLGLQGACKGGHYEIVEQMINAGAKNWNFGLIGACEGGHYDIVQLMIEKSDGGRNCGWDEAFRYACIGGNIKIIELLLNENLIYDINEGLYGACIGGDQLIVDLIINKGANSWPGGLLGSCIGGHKKLIDFMLSKGPNNFFTYSIEALYNNEHYYLLKKLYSLSMIDHHIYQYIFKKILLLLLLKQQMLPVNNDLEFLINSNSIHITS